MNLSRFHLYNGIVLIPEVAITSDGTYLDCEPVAVVSILDVEQLRIIVMATLNTQVRPILATGCRCVSAFLANFFTFG